MSGKHIAFFNFPSLGHLNPSLPVAAELVRRGHRVSYFVPEYFRDAVAATGATPVEYVTTAPADWEDIKLSLTPSFEDIVTSLKFQTEEGFAPVSAAERHFAGDRPDAIVYDAYVFQAGKLLARKWGVPGVMACTTFAANERYSPYASFADDLPFEIDQNHPDLVELAKVTPATLEEHGVSAEEFAAPNEAATLVFMPRAFQLGQEHFDDSYKFVGPSIGDGSRHEDADWTPPTDGRPLLLIAMGSHDYENRAEFYRQCVAAFADSPWHVLMAVGSKIDLAELGPLPSNFDVRAKIPQLQVLRHTKVFITHGGMNSAMEGLANGVAMVVVPRLPEQALSADQVAALGLGRKIAPTEATAAALRSAVDELAADDLAQQRLRQMAEDIRQAGGTTAAADAIEAVLA